MAASGLFLPLEAKIAQRPRPRLGGTILILKDINVLVNGLVVAVWEGEEGRRDRYMVFHLWESLGILVKLKIIQVNQ